MPAHATPNGGIASAKRLMELRQRWFNRRRIAEISVPAWPIPIHQTKLVMANPHMTGLLMPQMPTPVVNSTATAHRNTSSSAKPNPKQANQKSGVFFVSTTELIWSVTVPKVYPGAITGRPVGTRTSKVSRSSAILTPDLRIRIPQDAQVSGARACVQVLQNPVVQLFRLHFRHAAVRIVAVSEDDCFGRT